VHAWLNPALGDPPAWYAIVDDKRHPYYEHMIAAGDLFVAKRESFGF